MEERLPTLKQIANRTHDGHVEVLRRLVENPDALVCNRWQNPRGVMTMVATLRRWECLHGWAVTDRGHELLNMKGQ